MIVKQQGHRLQALEIKGRQQKVPKVLCPKDQNLLCDNIFEITLADSMPTAFSARKRARQR